jgi:hypothetical protein
MIVFQDGRKLETIDLKKYNDKQALHDLFQSYGFVLKKDNTQQKKELIKQLISEIRQYREQKKKLLLEEQERRQREEEEEEEEEEEDASRDEL